jgi:hypothetical protein
VADTRQGEAVLADAAAAYQDALGGRLIAAYALGSLAHGGFSPLVSDVDLGLVLAGPLRPGDRLTVRRVAQRVRAGGTPLHQRLSVFWGTPPILAGRSRGGRFPPLDRLDLLDHGRLLRGREARTGVARPGPGELLVAGARFALGALGDDPGWAGRLRGLPRRRPGDARAVEEIRHPPLLVARGPRRLTKAVLFPVRFLFTAATGQAGTNARAAGHYLARPDAAAPALVNAALGWRLEPPASAVAAAALLRQELIPLYAEYLGDHISRLRAVGEPRLAARFQRWRARLLA